MKTITILILLLCVPLFALANHPENALATTEVEFSDPDIENLPPVEEMTGVIITDTVYTEKDAETHLAHGRKCRRRHGHRGCRNHAHPYPHPPLYNNYHFNFSGNICRSGWFFCYLNFPGPIGVSCQCYGHFGNIWLRGQVSLY